MAKIQRGWLRKKKYANGLTWLFCFQVTRPSDGKRVENCKPVGLVAAFPGEKAAWVEVGKLGLAEHWRLHELRREGVIGKKAAETVKCSEHNLDKYVLPRWGGCVAGRMRPSEVEGWFEVLATEAQGIRKNPLKWPTIDKINSVMSQVYAHAQRQGLIPAELNTNPFRPPKLGGARCKSVSDYEAKVVSPQQMVAILVELDQSETKLEWTLALVHGATALRPEECFALKWCDVDYANNQILVRRAWSKGKLTCGKTSGSMKPVPMHPALAHYLNEWRSVTPYSNDSDWVFASAKEEGRIPRSASTCGKDYLRPAAVAAGVISEGDNSRFGWHNLRHSLATFFGSNDVHPSVIQTVLRHTKQQTTSRYIHSVNDKQLEAQGLYLDAIKIRSKGTQPSDKRQLRVESRVGEKSSEYVTA
jgi:integrase